MEPHTHTIDLEVSPTGSLEMLSQFEVSQLHDADRGGVHDLFRRCSLAVLNSGSVTDDAAEIFNRYADYEVEIIQRARGIRLAITNAPSKAFVDGRMIAGIKEHMFAVLRDIVYIKMEIECSHKFQAGTSASITDAVFHIIRNARVIEAGRLPDLIVCWGGHSISRIEYDYTKSVGYELGLRGMQICTGCGPGAMKGPMKGATIAHAKQRRTDRRYVGITEPGIIAAEPPNPIVNQLVIMPDIEKRLEAFVRVGHGIVVFPGGAGTAEEILYIAGLLLHPDNQDQKIPVVFTGPKEAKSYFEQIDHMIGATLGDAARGIYQIIIDDPPRVAQAMAAGMEDVLTTRGKADDAYYFNWLLNVPEEMQQPFEPTHENMGQLALHRDQPAHLLAANLRRAFSGIVSGNVKENGIKAIKEHGPFAIKGEPEVMKPVDEVLRAFVAQQRMKLPGTAYQPCYEIVV